MVLRFHGYMVFLTSRLKCSSDSLRNTLGTHYINFLWLNGPSIRWFYGPSIPSFTGFFLLVVNKLIVFRLCMGCLMFLPGLSHGIFLESRKQNNESIVPSTSLLNNSYWSLCLWFNGPSTTLSNGYSICEWDIEQVALWRFEALA